MKEKWRRKKKERKKRESDRWEKEGISDLTRLVVPQCVFNY